MFLSEWRELPSAPCLARKNNLMIARVSILLKSRASLTCVRALDAGLLARSQYSEGPVTDHLDTGSSSFPCVYKQMLRWLPRLQVATTCF